MFVSNDGNAAGLVCKTETKLQMKISKLFREHSRHTEQLHYTMENNFRLAKSSTCGFGCFK